MEIGVDSFAAILRDPTSGIDISPTERLANLLEEVECADQAGIDIFGVGEHHRSEFLDSAPAISKLWSSAPATA
jgi:alkanesulfonate monooxygenase SsuD/methylene tetrahydromethanopterin reductase-like flavin-dependent oxidoreductase (luciferase family)